MNSNGLVLIGFGIWVIVQVFAGDALHRLRILPDDSTASTS